MSRVSLSLHAAASSSAQCSSQSFCFARRSVGLGANCIVCRGCACMQTHMFVAVTTANLLAYCLAPICKRCMHMQGHWRTLCAICCAVDVHLQLQPRPSVIDESVADVVQLLADQDVRHLLAHHEAFPLFPAHVAFPMPWHQQIMHMCQRTQTL